jgi:hypothetical protein
VDAKTGSKILEERRRQALREDIRKLLSTSYLETAKGHLLVHEVDVQLDMLRSLVMDRIPRHVDARDVVAVDYHGRGHRAFELAEELAQPSAFGNGVGDAAVFRFSAGT